MRPSERQNDNTPGGLRSNMSRELSALLRRDPFENKNALGFPRAF